MNHEYVIHCYGQKRPESLNNNMLIDFNYGEFTPVAFDSRCGCYLDSHFSSL